MRRLAFCALVLLSASPVSAAGPQVTDPAGDANGVEVASPASLPAYDITAVRWWADTVAQRVSMTFVEGGATGRYVLTWATPSCETNSLEWQTRSDFAFLQGCKPRHVRWPAVPVWSGRTLTFTIPRRDLPTWLAPRTVLSSLAASAAPLVDFRTGAAYPVVDTAKGSARYVVGT